MVQLRGLLYIASRIVLLLATFWECAQQEEEDQMFDILNKNATEIIRLRGYMAEEHNIVVEGGYILNMVRATNPLINAGQAGLANRSVVFFLHGTLGSAKYFTVHSAGASPRDYSHLDASQMSRPELLRLLEENNSKHSLVFTLLNFGHEVWLLNRRGNYYSQGNIHQHKQAHLDLNFRSKLYAEALKEIQRAFESINTQLLPPNKYSQIIELLPKPLIDLNNLKLIPNPRYWDFTIDDMVKHDLPASVEYVLEQTGRKRVAFVGHSSGGGIGLQALSLNRELNEKSLDLSANKHENLVLTLAALFEIPLKLYKGDLPPEVLSPLVQNLGAIVCANEALRNSLCSELFELIFGPGAEQNYLVPGDFTGFPDVVASHELGQLAQYTRAHVSTMYDYGRPGNLAKYGTPNPPAYNMSEITTDRLMIFHSQYDTLVPQAAIRRIMEGLVVPYESVSIDETNHWKGLKFNHQSYAIHRSITPILIEPSLRAIQAAGVE